MYLLFDIGGTNMRLAVSKDGRKIAAVKAVPTPKNFIAGMKLFRDIASSLAQGKPWRAAIGGVAGPLDAKHTQILFGSNLEDWEGKPLLKELIDWLHAPVYLENDAALGGLGEAVYGAGNGRRIVAFLTISTGVGGARIVDKHIDRNASGFEPGHQIINSSVSLSAPYHEQSRLEQYIGGRYVEKRENTQAQDIQNPMVWDELAKFLAIGLNNVCALWSPNIVVLGGSMITKKQGIPLTHVKKYLGYLTAPHQQLPEIKKAALGDQSGLYGALAYLRQIKKRP